MKNKKLKAAKYKGIYWLVKGLIAVASVTPRKVLQTVGSRLGSLAYYIFKKERNIINQNLRYISDNKISDEQAELFGKKVFRNIGINAMDLMYAFRINSVEKFDKLVVNKGFEHVEKAQEKGKGIIILTCHLGAFELLSPNLALRGYPLHVVGKRLKDERLNELLVYNRTSRGSQNIYSGEETIRLIRTLKKGQMVGILIDQDIKKMKGTFVDFYGKPAYTPIGATILALKTDAAVIPTATRRLPNNKHLITFLPELELIRTGNEEEDIRINTERFNKALEGLIREDPTQWVWLHQRWKTKPQEVTSA